MTDDVIEHEFPVSSQSELTIKNISGRIEVATGDDSAITLRAIKRGAPRAVENTRIEWSHEGNRVRIQTKGEKGGLLNITRSVSAVEYDIRVPRDCTVNAEGVSADVLVRGILLPVRVQSVSGDVHLQDITGEAQITTVSGEVVVQHMQGALSLRTTSGDTSVSDSKLSHFNLNSVSGDFSVDTALGGQHYLAKTVSGDLTLHLRPGTGATVQMKSVSGDVVCEVPAEIIKAGRRNWQGRINGGGATVEMNSVSGDMRIKTNENGKRTTSTIRDEGAVSPSSFSQKSSFGKVATAVPSAAPPAKDTSSVLKALERGEISVEEALSRLDDLG